MGEGSTGIWRGITHGQNPQGGPGQIWATDNLHQNHSGGKTKRRTIVVCPKMPGRYTGPKEKILGGPTSTYLQPKGANNTVGESHRGQGPCIRSRSAGVGGGCKATSGSEIKVATITITNFKY
eukprot:775588-Karenia_brevis.AAC.1